MLDLERGAEERWLRPPRGPQEVPPMAALLDPRIGFLVLKPESHIAFWGDAVLIMARKSSVAQSWLRSMCSQLLQRALPADTPLEPPVRTASWISIP